MSSVNKVWLLGCVSKRRLDSEREVFPKDTRGLPQLDSVGITIAYPLHIWE